MFLRTGGEKTTALTPNAAAVAFLNEQVFPIRNALA